MMTMRCWALAFCMVAVALLLGCDDSSFPGRSISSAETKPTHNSMGSATIIVKPKAAAIVKQLIAGQGAMADCFLRIRVVPGGCQGYLHKLDLDPVTTFEDHTFESGGVKVVIFKRQTEMLRGAEVDYGMIDGQTGFKIENPNFDGESTKKWLSLLKNEKDID